MRTLFGIAFAGAMIASAALADQMAMQPGTQQAVSAKSERFSADMERAMLQMHSGMMAVAATGNPDRDFLAQMVPHHQGAVDMAKAVLLATDDPRIRNLAQSIITEQQYEIELMKTMLAEIGKTPANTSETLK